MKVLVTGGAGYIGSHTVVALLEAGHEVVVVDSLCNSKRAALERVVTITGRDLSFVHADLRDAEALDATFESHDIDAVIHFAGLKAVGESTQQPLEYYDNNIGGTLTLLSLMADHEVRTLIFSSSATVYGAPESVPIPETAALSATNPYGQTKLMIEQILQDLAVSDPRWSLTLLRYFNPVGAHVSGLIGEDPVGIPNNLVPYIARVASGSLEKLSIYGGDYDTPDGTGVRDYIHVVDLAQGHMAALKTHHATPGVHVYNLGTGQGISVLEMRAAFEKTCGRPIPYQVVDRRAGDIGSCYADATHARESLGWTAERQLEDMTADAWRWQSQNPTGYPDDEA